MISSTYSWGFFGSYFQFWDQISNLAKILGPRSKILAKIRPIFIKFFEVIKIMIFIEKMQN